MRPTSLKFGADGDQRLLQASSATVALATSTTKAQASPRITRVLMSSLKHSAHATWTVPVGSVAGVGGTGTAITIRAKGDGAAAGAAGNDWSMTFDRASTYSAAKPLDIAVDVDPKGKRVTVRFNNGPATATLGDLIAALNADDDFSALFSAGFTSCDDAATNNASRAALGLVTARNIDAGFSDTGRTQFAVEVNFNAYVDAIANNELLVDVLTATAVRAKLAWTGDTATRFGLVNVAATGGDNAAAAGVLTIFADLNADSPALPAVTAGVATVPVRMVRYEFETSQVKFLPMERDLVHTDAGHQGAATAIAGPPAYPAITAVTAVATGYAADASTPPGGTADADNARDTVDENFNGPSQVRISVSTSVKAPS